MAKSNLPKDWVLVTSTKDPGRNYYFNTATNKSSWILPDDSDNQSSQNTRKNVNKKRKKNEDNERYRPHTPEEDVDVERRPKLLAKRKLSTAKSSNANNKQNSDTPQMKALREKMLQRQAAKKPRPPKSSTIKTPGKDNDAKTPERASKILKVIDADDRKQEDSEKSTVMTPAMKEMREKAQARKSMSVIDKKKVKSSPKSQSARLSLARNNKSMSDNTVSSSASTSTASTSAETETRGLGSPRTRASKSLCSISSPRRKSSKIALESKFKQIKTLEAPPGVSAKRILVTDVETSKVETSPVILAKIPKISKKAVESPEIPPKIYKNAEDRMKALCNNLKTQRSSIGSLDDSGSSAATIPVDEFYEEMEWEPSEEEKIVFEIQNVRAQLNDDDVQMKESSNTGLDLKHEVNSNLRKLYIVVDTNVLLSNIKAIEEARDAVFKFYNRPIIVVPWTVVRELDFIKSDRSKSRPENLKVKARHAIQFLNNHFAAKHPRILGQTFTDVLSNRLKFDVECPDDEILQTCLQVQSAGHHVVLLSYDKNLCNKAMIHDVIFLGKNDPLEKVDYLKESEIKKRFSLAESLQDTEQEQKKAEDMLAEELFEDLKATLTSFLSVVITKEMKNLFGDNWERFTIFRPPWTVVSVLKCANKHWIAAVSESFERRAESIIKDLLQTVTDLQYNRRLKDVENMIQLFHELVSNLKAEKYPNILGNVNQAIDGLKQKLRDNLKSIYRSTEDERQQEEAKAELALGYIDTVYLFARDVCGTAAQLMNMPCALPFKKIDSPNIVEDMKRLRPEIAGNLNKLMQILSTALNDIDHLNVDHPFVQDLCKVLVNFLPEMQQIDQPLTTLDVYCCFKYKQEYLKRGLGQLEELSTYFCRMATFNCL